ncbi:hypothetical protein NL343_28380, partial [Klebsiella pneumoniae]|nr:hypothetical protein [Klebsiella pneumoniae]
CVVGLSPFRPPLYVIPDEAFSWASQSSTLVEALAKADRRFRARVDDAIREGHRSQDQVPDLRG